MTRAVARWIWPTIGVALVALPSLPLPAWSGSPDRGPVWEPNVESWTVGVALVLIGSLLAARLGMGLRRTGGVWPDARATVVVPVVVLALTAAAVVMLREPAGNPQQVDEIAQLFRARRLTAWPDPTVRFRPEYTPPERCQVEMRRDLGGVTLYRSLAWCNEVGLASGIVYTRDRNESNGPLPARYQGWDLWRYAPSPDGPNAPPVLTRLQAAAGPS